MKRTRTSLGFICLVALSLGRAQAQDLIEEPLRIPMPEAGSKGLEAFMVRPNDAVAHPLALLTHGTPREGSERDQVTALAFVPQAREFARRGWTTVIVVRRGYGTSGGRYAEDARACSRRPEYYDAGRESAKDLRTSILYLSKLPQVDPTRILSVGISAGGFANVALTADPPPGLIASISFAGGRGSRKPDEVCNPNDLVRAFNDFGKTSHVPMLWVYAENDHFFGPQIAVAFHQAFTRTGGQAAFVRVGPFRRDGHGLFSAAGIPIWTPIVDDFLASQNLRLRTDLLSLPAPPDIPPPASLAAEGLQEWRNFLTLPDSKAFAISSGGHYGYVYARHSDKDARKLALERCNDSTSRTDRCQLVDWQAGRTP